MTELLVGTKKGLFALAGEPGAHFEVTGRAFAGEPVEYAMRDPGSGRVLASVTSPFYGPKIWYADDPAGDWEQAAGVSLPEGGDTALERIWVIVAGEVRYVLLRTGSRASPFTQWVRANGRLVDASEWRSFVDSGRRTIQLYDMKPD